MSAPIALRSLAILIAVLGMIDPALTLERPSRQPLTIAMQREPASAAGIERHGTEAGQRAWASAVALERLLSNDYDVRVRQIGSADRAAACTSGTPCVLVGGDQWPAPISDGRSPIVGAVRVAAPEGASVAIANATVPTATHRSAVGRLDVRLIGRGVSGQRSTIEVLDEDVPVGRATHEWTGDAEATVGIDWWPMDSGVRKLSIRATRPDAGGGEDDRVDVGAVVDADPHRVLVYDTRPSWTSTFVRRAIERDRRLSVRVVARLGPQLQVTAGEPFRMDEAALADASAVVIGALDALSSRDVDVLETFVRVRGGSLILVPDRKPTGPAARLIPSSSIERLEPAPVRVGDWRASELLVFRDVPAGASTLARAGNDAVVIAVPSGNGRVIVSGAMDAWRYRDADGDAFDRAWQSLIADAAAAGGRPLEVTFDSAAVRLAETGRVSVRVRSMTPPNGGVAVSASLACGDMLGRRSRDEGGRALRLWPTGDRRVFEGRFAPSEAGTCRVAVSSSTPVAGSATADLVVIGSDPAKETATMQERATGGTLERIARRSDARIIAPGDETTLAGDVRRLAPVQTAAASVRPMQSPWWIVPFAGCLGAEWWLRRRRGLR